VNETIFWIFSLDIDFDGEDVSDMYNWFILCFW